MSEDSTNQDVAASLFGQIWPGGLAAQAIYLAARLDLADRLASGPKTAEQLAVETESQVGALQRLLAALVSLGMLTEDPSAGFGLATGAEALGSDGFVHPWATFLGSPFVWNSWGALHETLRTGETAFDRVHGMPMYQYMAEHPEVAAIYDAAMDSGAEMTVPAVVEAYDFSRFETLVDVGGGRGMLIAGILEANPGLAGVLFDLPGVVASADARLTGGALAGRCAVCGGDAFDGVPAADAILMKSVIHSYDDDAATRLLRRCRESVSVDGRLLLVELVPEPGSPADPGQGLMDLMMLALVSGRERSRSAFESLLAGADFELLEVISTSRGNAIIEARPI